MSGSSVKIIEIRREDEVVTSLGYLISDVDFENMKYNKVEYKSFMFNRYTKSIYIFGKKIITLKKVLTEIPYDLKITNKSFIKTRDRNENINAIIG